MTRYFGKVCEKHPELNGERLKSNSSCIACRNEKRHAQIRNKYRADPEFKEKYLSRKKEQKKRNYNPAFHTKNYRARRAQRMPRWANISEIEKVYSAAKEAGMTVDHYYPLFGKTVSGLHVAANLRVIPQSENDSKGNKHPDEFYGEVK